MNKCENCGQPFLSKNKKKFCSFKCSIIKNSKDRIARGHYGYCAWCKKPNKQSYHADGSFPMFCSHVCAGEYRKSLRPEANRICKNCGKHFRTNPAYIKRRKSAGLFCNRECFYEFKRKNPSKFIDAEGYMRVGARTREHRLVIEKHLNRKLKKEEHVHHINGNKLDNRVENLEVLSCKEHHFKHERRTKIPKERYDEFKRMYLDKKCMLNDIAKHFGVSKTGTKVVARRLGIYPKRYFKLCHEKLHKSKELTEQTFKRLRGK